MGCKFKSRQFSGKIFYAQYLMVYFFVSHEWAILTAYLRSFQGDKAEQQEKIFDLLEKEREKRQKLRKSKQEAGILKSKTSKSDKKSKKTVRGDHFKKKFRKTFEILFEEEEQRLKRNLKDENEKVISYQT